MMPPPPPVRTCYCLILLLKRITIDIIHLFRASLTQDVVGTPSGKTNLERKLTVKSNELQKTREKCKDLEIKEGSLLRENKSLKSQVEENEILVKKVEAERNALERDMAHYITENKVGLCVFITLESPSMDQTMITVNNGSPLFNWCSSFRA